jgi:alpha-ketoglutarate-dependent taurine dioxygenase
MASTAGSSNGLTIRRRHPLIGTEVRGIDLGRPLDDTTLAELNVLWTEHLVLVFPSQPISDEQHIAFGSRFGELEIHPSVAHRSSRNEAIYRVSNVDEAGRIIPSQETAWQYINLSWLWHTDSSFREIPSKGSILHGIETTNAGGNTLFANMYAAYDDLPDDMKLKIEGRWVIHDHDFIIKQSKALSAKQDKGKYDALPPVRHPLVQRHPVTQRRSLFLSPHTMVNIEGMAAAEGRQLLDALIAHAIQPKYVYRHVWTKDDIVMWDNRCTMHSVEPFDNATIRRIMHRVTLVGEGRPMAA